MKEKSEIDSQIDKKLKEKVVSAKMTQE